MKVYERKQKTKEQNREEEEEEEKEKKEEKKFFLYLFPVSGSPNASSKTFFTSCVGFPFFPHSL